MQWNCNTMTLNVRGLRNPVKKRSIFCFLKDQKCETYFLQETYSELSDEIIWRSEWGGVIFFSHGSTLYRGGFRDFCDYKVLPSNQNMYKTDRIT